MGIRVCFVCLGNICRSPTAEAVFRAKVDEAGLGSEFAIESAGTAAYHVGESPDRRSAAAASRRGIQVHGSAQRFDEADFDRFDHVIAMDASNRDALVERASTPEDAAKVSLLRAWDPQAGTGSELDTDIDVGRDVPDPYYGGARGFDDVLDICERSCAALLTDLRARTPKGAPRPADA